MLCSLSPWVSPRVGSAALEETRLDRGVRFLHCINFNFDEEATRRQHGSANHGACTSSR